MAMQSANELAEAAVRAIVELDTAHHFLALAAFRMTERSILTCGFHPALFLQKAVGELLGPDEKGRIARIHAALFRDITGNPFRPCGLDPALRTTTVTNLAHAAYDQRTLTTGTLDLARLAILADALEEAGCTNTDILNHLRGPDPHIRGCWALDALLGQSPTG
jgi:hypothetical protein